MVRSIWRLAMGLAPDVRHRKSCAISYNRIMRIWRQWERKQNKKLKLHRQKVDQDQKIQVKIERNNYLNEQLVERRCDPELAHRWVTFEEMRATYLQRPGLRDLSDDQIIAAWVSLQGVRAAEASAVNGGGDPTPLQNQRVVVRIKRAGQVFHEFRSSWQRHQKLESARKPTIMIHGALRSIKLLYGAKKRFNSKQPLDEQYFQAMFEDSKEGSQSSSEISELDDNKPMSQLASVSRRRCEG